MDQEKKNKFCLWGMIITSIFTIVMILVVRFIDKKCSHYHAVVPMFIMSVMFIVYGLYQKSKIKKMRKGYVEIKQYPQMDVKTNLEQPVQSSSV